MRRYICIECLWSYICLKQIWKIMVVSKTFNMKYVPTMVIIVTSWNILSDLVLGALQKKRQIKSGQRLKISRITCYHNI